jgi:membrane dipeptidase
MDDQTGYDPAHHVPKEPFAMDRRKFMSRALVVASSLFDRAQAQSAPIFVGDMHFHSFFGDSSYHSRPVAAALAAGNATLVAWSLTGDLLWYDFKLFKPKSPPKPGEAFGWFERELGRIKTHVAEQRLKLVRTPADVDRALRGEPHIVLAVEGASFVEKDAARVRIAHGLGLRHLQLVHYIRNTIGDLQTDAAQHQGLSEIGRHVVRECNRLGILVDVAHCTEGTVRDVLSTSRKPVVWSHGSVARHRSADASAPIWRRRQLSLDVAKEIAGNGGVVGLWSLAPDIGNSIEAYADRMLELSEWLGENHVAFGSDLNGLGRFGMLQGYADVRRVIDLWRSRGVAEDRIRKLAIGNYARVLKIAVEPDRA